jgi:phosphotriesterase-related protein
MDRFGVADIFPTDRRIATVLELHRRGFGGALMLSHDSVCDRDRIDPPDIVAQRQDWKLTFVLGAVRAALEVGGIPASEVSAMLTTNVHRWLAGGQL